MSLAIALTKGRLEKKTIELLEQKGYGIESLKAKGRQLVFQDTKKDVKYFLVKANDCITYVEHGVADVGVVGKDTLMEGGKDYYELLDLGFGRCKFIVGGMEGKNPLEKTGHVKIGTKYPNVALDYATTVEPTGRFSVEPIETGTRVSAPSSTFRTARSVEESSPTTHASTFSPEGIST